MTPTDYRNTLAALGISQARLGRLVKVNKDTTTNWAKGGAKGNSEVPGAVALILRALSAGLVTIDQLEAL